MIQMLFKRGIIDPTGMSEYTIDRSNDAFGNLIPETVCDISWNNSQTSKMRKHYCNITAGGWEG
jgi:hypothetical protein